MQIQQESFLELMAKPDTRFVIPVFQRVYSWDARQCNELWEDIMAAGAQTDETAEPHFMGMLLYSADTETWHGTSMFDVIDGQQRMTTMTLLLCALARHLDETGMQVGGLSANDMFERYLRIGSGASAVGKLTLSFMDRETLFALLGIGTMPTEPAGRLIDNLELALSQLIDGHDPADLQLMFDEAPQMVDVPAHAGKTFVDLFEQAATDFPANVAVRDGKGSLTYAELDAASAAVAATTMV